jgi:uncharacterized protein (TIGR03437 family)
MDAAFAAFKKTAFFFSLALLAATPRLAQADTPSFTSPPAGYTYQLVSGISNSVNVTGSDDTALTPQLIGFKALVTYASGDQPWLEVGSDSTAGAGGTCSGASTSYQTPITLSLQLGCYTPNTGTHTATVKLVATSPSGVPPVTFSVTFTTGGGVVSTLVPSPTSLTGTNAMSVTAGAQTSASVTLATTSSAAITFATSSNASWLTISPFQGNASSATPATLTFTANAATLPAGSYSAKGTISYGTNQTVTVQVALTVTASAVSLSPNTLAWSYTNGTFNPSGSQSLTLATPNADPYTARISYATGATATNWLLVNSASSLGGLVNGSIFSVSLANYAALATGSYTGTITVSDNYDSDYYTTLVVTLTVSTTTSSLTVTPSPIGLSSADGYEQLMTVTSTVSGTLTVSASSTNSWLSVSAPPTTIAAGVAVYLTVSANTNLSGSGVYAGTVTVTVGTVTQLVPVNLTAGTTSTVTSSGFVAPTTINFIAESGTLSVSQQVVFAGTGTFQISPATTYTPNNGTAWLTMQYLDGALSSTGATVTITAHPGSLTAGSYTATVPIAVYANGSPQPAVTLTVNLVVTSGEVMQAAVTPAISGVTAPGTMLFNNGGTAPTGTIAVTTTGGTTPLPISVTADEAWITASVEGGATSTPATLLVTATTSGMLDGMYAGNVIVASPGYATLHVPVVVVVTGVTNPSGLTVSEPSLTFAAQLGAGSPASQALAVSSATAGTAFTAVATGSTGTGITWLSISPNGQLSTNQTITATANISGLGVGNYTGNIALGANGATVNIPVNLVISSGSTTQPTGGDVTVSSSTLAFSAGLGATAPASQTLTVSSAAGSASVPFTAAATSTGNWLAVSPASGTTQSNLIVSVNQTGLSAGNHTGSITITPTGGTVVVVTVSLSVVSEPTFSVSPQSLTFAYQAGSGNAVSPGQLTVTASGGAINFTASASSSANWLAVTPLSGSTSTTATLAVQVSPASLPASATPYTGTITITGVNGTTGTATVSVSINVTTPLPVISAVLNAASFASGPVAPGEIVSIFGTQIGPTTPANLTLTGGKVSTSAGGVTVSFSGYLAPLIYVSSTQINAVVPYELSGNKGPFVEVIFAGQKSNEPSLQLTTSAPGIFTLNGSGSGPGAILNPDGTVNTQANPAAAGSEIVIYSTGEGLTTPASVTGGVTAVNTSGTGPLTPAPQLAVSVMIGGQPAQVLFDGEAPYMVAGVMQVNAVIPASVRSGAASVTVQVGKNVSTSGVTVWVK